MVITTRSFPCNHDFKYVGEVYVDGQQCEEYHCFKCDATDVVPVAD